MLKTEKKPEYSAYIFLLVTAIIWGGTWPLGRWLVSEEVGGETIPPMMIASIRYFIVLCCFLVILRWREGSLNIRFAKEHWKMFTFMGIISVTIYQAGYLIGEYYTAASDASVIISSHPILVMVFAVFMLKMENFDKKKIVGTFLSFFGVVIIFGFSPNANVPNRILGNIIIFIASVSYSLYIAVSKYFFNECKMGTFQPSSLYINGWVAFFGFLTTYPVALFLNPEYFDPILYFQVPDRVWVGIAYLAFLSSIVGYWLYLEGIKRLNASQAAIFQNLVPIVGVTSSAFLLGEKIDLLIHGFSLLLIISGITLVNYSQSDKKSNTESPI
ncbi:MAG: DMT family transporter [Candidatus Hodarchaeales archaeon]|jgi:drug/metabolite transporter (DMT)-like permease